MAVYGDQLSFFSEQFRMFNYFSMQPETVSAFTPRVSLGKVRGILQFMKKGELSREGDTLNDVNVPTLWTRQKLTIGNFIEFEDDTYRIQNDYPWFFEGGFYCYGLETVAGSTDEQEEDTEVNLGQGYYD